MDEQHTLAPPGVTDIILESISDGVFTVNHEWRIMSFNRAAERITGIAREEAIGSFCWEVFRSNMCESGCVLRRAMEEERSFASSTTYIINSEGKRIPITLSTSPLRDESGAILGGVEVFRDNSVEEELRNELHGSFRQGEMISRSHLMKKIFSILPQLAVSESSVLIVGETGTGKELMARSLHDLSRRSDQPFMAINCGALPDTLLESELFGYKTGAFTGAVRDKPGYFSLAKGGTLLLDELGEISPAFQVKLLRVLDERTFYPLGAVRGEEADVRIVAATNRDLDALVREGRFRRDLLYRINVACLNLPPLRRRTEDIPLLVEQFVRKMNRLQGKAIEGIEAGALERLMRHDYPGNIRELENIIEHAFILCEQGRIALHHLPPSLLETSAPVLGAAPPARGRLAASLHEDERTAILQALARNDYNRLATARELGIHKSTLFRKIKRLGIVLPDRDGRHRQPVTTGA